MDFLMNIAQSMNLEVIAFLALIIFVLTYLLFMAGMVHKTVAALLGAMLMVVYGVLEYDTIGTYIDYKTLTVAVGMMITIAVVNKSGLFEYISIKAAKLTNGDPVKLMVMIVILSVVVSTFFSNITSTIVLGTLVVSLCALLELDFIPYLFAITLSVNIGGILTPVSSLPNMMISTAADLSFIDFGKNLLVLGIILIIVAIIYFRIIFRKEFGKRTTKLDRGYLQTLDENKEIKDKPLFIKSCIILFLIVVFFLIQDYTGVGNEGVAISGAILMLVLSGADPEEMLSEVQWSTIAFFVGLFIVVGGVEHVGLLEKVAHFMAERISGEISAVLSVLGGSAIASSIVDNIPVTAILIPIIKNLNSLLGIAGNTLYWPLVIGTAIGGNITPIASPANVLALGIAEKNRRKISWGQFIKIGGTLAIIHFIISAVYFYIITLI